jgi:hypothetical protein
VVGWIFALRDDDFTSALEGFGWPDAFVRELSLVSPSKLSASGDVVSPGATPDLRVVIATPTGPHAGVDIHVHLADEVLVRGGQPLDVRIHVSRTSVELVLGPDAGRVRGRALRFRMLDKEAVGDKAQLGRPYPPESDFDDDRFWQPR